MFACSSSRTFSALLKSCGIFFTPENVKLHTIRDFVLVWVRLFVCVLYYWCIVSLDDLVNRCVCVCNVEDETESVKTEREIMYIVQRWPLSDLCVLVT